MSKQFRHDIEKLIFTYKDGKLTVVVTVYDIVQEVYTEMIEEPATQKDFINICRQVFDDKVQDCWKYGI